MAEKLIHQYDEKIPATTDFVLVDNGSGYYEKAKVQNVGTGGGGSGIDATNPVIVDARMISQSLCQVSFPEVVTLTTLGFSFTKNGSAWAITSLAGGSAIWYFQMESNSAPDDVLRISYSVSTGNSVDSSGNELSAFTNVPIGNYGVGGAAIEDILN